VSDFQNQAGDARYAIGIDLGTTHSALSYVDLEASDGENTAQGVLPVPQLADKHDASVIAPAEVEL
jgi:molecular chaperone DnaK (HSP70)